MNHYHWYGTTADFIEVHNHGFEGYTGPSIPHDDSHVHEYQGITTLDDGHRHQYGGVTGP
ncbi:MAG: YmaF family protein, partial [Bacillota bacterium]